MAFSPLEKSILRTLTYFDLYDYPLAAAEVWKWLYKPECAPFERSLNAVSESLDGARLSKQVERTEGFYHLPGRGGLVIERKQRNNRVDEQLPKVARIVKILRLFPSIRMIAIGSSLAMGNVKADSDIDFFIVARSREIWLARFFSAGLLKALRRRPNERRKRDRFCLTFFITDDALNLERGAFGDDDILYHYYVQSLIPVYDPDDLHGKILDANPWLKRLLPNAHYSDGLTIEVERPRWVVRLHRIADVALTPVFRTWLYPSVMSLQLKIMPAKLKSLANMNTSVILSDTMLKFYDKDIRRDLAMRWRERTELYA